MTVEASKKTTLKKSYLPPETIETCEFILPSSERIIQALASGFAADFPPLKDALLGKSLKNIRGRDELMAAQLVDSGSLANEILYAEGHLVAASDEDSSLDAMTKTDEESPEPTPTFKYTISSQYAGRSKGCMDFDLQHTPQWPQGFEHSPITMFDTPLLNIDYFRLGMVFYGSTPQWKFWGANPALRGYLTVEGNPLQIIICLSGIHEPESSSALPQLPNQAELKLEEIVSKATGAYLPHSSD